MKDEFKKIADTVFKDVFGRKNTFSVDALVSKFAIDIPRASEVKCALSGVKTWALAASGEKIASEKAIEDKFKKDGWIQKTKDLTSIEDVLSAWNNINYITGEKYINSKNVFESDGVQNSNMVDKSTAIFDSKNIIASYKLVDCVNMLASRDSSSCTYGIRMKESIYCSSDFEVSWSNKVSRSLFIHDCFDLFECMFCSHIRSRKYCIANMQFEKEEYFRLKEKVIDWILMPN